MIDQDLVFDGETQTTSTSTGIEIVEGETWSNWSNLLDYIKLNLGASVNSIEFTDQEIINIIKNHVLPEFSRYVPYEMYYLLYENTDAIQSYPFYIYQINTDKIILRVNSLIRKPNLLDLSQYYNIQQNGGDITNYLITMNTVTMASDVIPQDTWKFRSPNKLEVIKGSNNYGVSNDFIVTLDCVHPDPSTIDVDQYKLLKNLALAEIQIYLGKVRTKFQTFNTPQAQVDLLASELLQEGKELKDRTIQELDELTPDHFVWFLN